MTMRSIALFAHVLGMLALFVALAVEWLSVELLRTVDQVGPSAFATTLLRQLPRITGVAVALILFSGIDLAVQFGLLRSPWVGVSFAAMVLMAGIGGAALRPLLRTIRSSSDANGTLARQASNTSLRVSFRARVGVALGIVYLMVAKPDLLESALIVTLALAVGAIGGIVPARSSPMTQRTSRNRDVVPKPMGGSR
jgi:hypothetical protein